AAERLLRLGEKALDVGLPGRVGLHGDRPAALARDLGEDAVGALLAGGVVDDHRRPLVGEMLRDGSADALRRAGEDGYFPLKSLQHGVAPVPGSDHYSLLVSDTA